MANCCQDPGHKPHLWSKLAILDGLAGAAPSVLAMGSNATNRRDFLDDRLFQMPPASPQNQSPDQLNYQFGSQLFPFNEPNADYEQANSMRYTVMR
jgi:hypothetical protein